MKIGTLTFAINFLAIIAVVYVLFIGKGLLIPFIVAVLFWFALITLADFFKKWRVPGKLAMLLSFATYLLVFWFILEIINNNVSQVIQLAPVYQQKFEDLIVSVLQIFNVTPAQSFDYIFGSLDIAVIVKAVAGAILGIFKSAGVVLVYLLFLLLEYKYFGNKINNIFTNKNQNKQVNSMITKIKRDVSSYFAIKTFVSFLTAIITYIVLWAFGVDFAIFWAFITFMFNFIPTVGSAVSVALPLIFALVQFDTLTPFFGVAIGLIATQIVTGNILDPKLMGNRLNISPLVLLIALGFWGSIWGFVGMLLSVPITLILNIILSEFPATRSISVMLSEKGYVKK